MPNGAFDLLITKLPLAAAEDDRFGCKVGTRNHDTENNALQNQSFEKCEKRRIRTED
jgi:hypothetical protein